MTKTTEWNRRFNGVGIKLEPQVVRVANDFVLDVYLNMDPKNCIKLAMHICRAYRNAYLEELKISPQSLAVEIYGHYKMQKAAMKAEELVGKNKACRWLLNHTGVIDCGAAEKDSNRWIWDGMYKMTKIENRLGLKHGK